MQHTKFYKEYNIPSKDVSHSASTSSASFPSTLDLSICQAVDQGVQHLVEKDVKQGKNLLLLLKVLSLGGQVYDDGITREGPDHTQVGERGGEGFSVSFF